MSAARLIAGKDLKLRLRDRSAIIVGIVAPLGLALIFNAVLGGVTDGDFVPAFAVTDLDQAEVSAGFIQVLEQIEAEGVIEIGARPATEEAARQLAEDGTVPAAIIIPEGFSDAVSSQQPVSITVIADPNDPVSAEIARSIAAGFASEVRVVQLAVVTAVGATDAPPDAATVERLAREASQGLPDAITVGRVETSTKELDLATFFAASMSVFFLFFTVSFGVNGLLEEQQQGTISRLIAAPIAQSSIVTGKAIVSFVLGIVSMTILIVMSSLLLGADWGNPLGVAALVVAGVFSATGLMMVVAAYAKTPEQAGNLQAILAVGLGMLGGIFFPGSLGTGVMSYIAYISPHRWFLVGLGDLASGDDLPVIVPSLLGLLAFGAIAWVFAMTRFRSRGLAT